jgi:hypothetical protein
LEEEVVVVDMCQEGEDLLPVAEEEAVMPHPTRPIFYISKGRIVEMDPPPLRGLPIPILQ